MNTIQFIFIDHQQFIMLIFETERLIVRQFTLADADNFFMINGDENVVRYIRKALTRKESDNFLAENIRLYIQNPKLGRWAVDEKENNRFVGSFAIIPLPFEDEKNKLQAGYALLPSAWNKGYATELTKAGIDFFFYNHKLNELHAITAIPNTTSQKVLLKCGFIENGIKTDGEELVLRYILKR